MKIPGLTASSIESYAAEGSYERGREYVDSGAVVSVRRTGPGHVNRPRRVDAALVSLCHSKPAVIRRALR